MAFSFAQRDVIDGFIRGDRTLPNAFLEDEATVSNDFEAHQAQLRTNDPEYAPGQGLLFRNVIQDEIPLISGFPLDQCFLMTGPSVATLTTLNDRDRRYPERLRDEIGRQIARGDKLKTDQTLVFETEGRHGITRYPSSTLIDDNSTVLANIRLEPRLADNPTLNLQA